MSETRPAPVRRPPPQASWGSEAWSGLWGALARTARTLRRHPGFAAGVVLTLGLGVGANAAMFGILDRLLFSPPARIVDHERVVRVMVVRPFLSVTSRYANFPFLDYQDWKAHTGFSAVAAFQGPEAQTLGRGVTATRIQVTLATHEFFALLGVAPALGRFYRAEEDRIEAPPTAVLGWEYFEAAFGGDPAALGRTLEIAGHTYTIVGVAPAGFTGVGLAPVDVWLPLVTSRVLTHGTQWTEIRGPYWLRAVARLADGVAVPAAAAQATALHVGARREQIALNRYPAETRVELDPLIVARGPEASADSRVARWLGGVSLMVLLIACANVGNLLLARGARRRREVAVRLSLGMGRIGLVAEMMLEPVLLALLGGGCALLVGAGVGGMVRPALFPGMAASGSGMSGRIVAFTLITAVLAGLMAGMAPALQAMRVGSIRDLGAGAGTSSGGRSRARGFLTVLQAGLSVVLLVGAGLFVRSVGEVRKLDHGLDVDRLVTASLEFEDGTDPAASAAPEESLLRNQIYATAIERLSAVPGVEAVAGTDTPFQAAGVPDLEIRGVPGLDSIPRIPGGGPFVQIVTPGYPATVGLGVVSGRDLGEGDGPDAERVALVNATMARILWPDADPLGKTILVGRDSDPVTVVGVVEDGSRGTLEIEPYMTYYVPIAQRPTRRLTGVYVRADEGSADQVASAIAPILRSFHPRVRFATIAPLRALIDPQARSWKLGATLFTAFGTLALLIAAIGLYSVLAFDVAQRTRELGIRSALGAEKRRLLATVVMDGVRMASIGVLLGLGIALFAGRWVAGLLFGVSPRDPWVLTLAVAVMMGTALLASLVPALRATRVDPMVALRSE